MADKTSDPMGRRRGRVIVWVIDLLLVAVFVAVILPGLVLSNQTLSTDEFWSDLFKLTQPTFTYTGTYLAAGQLPLWNPYWFAGYPQLAMPSACVFYPTTVLFGLFSFPVAIKVVSLLHVYLAGAFSYALGRNTFERRVPALYLAFAAIAGDLVLAPLRFSHLWELQTLTWFPLALLFADRIARGGRWGYVIGMALTITMMILGGDPQSLAFCLYFLAFYSISAGIFRLLRVRSAAATLMPIAYLALAVVLGAGIACVQLIPSRELYAESVRAHGVAFSQLALVSPESTLSTLAWLEQDDLVWIMSASRTVCALALAGVVFARSPQAFATLIAALFCLLYALMPRWFYDAIVQYVPIYNGVRGAVRMTLIVWWALAYLSAFGVAIWTRPREEALAHQSRLALFSFGALAGVTLLPPLMGVVLPAGRLLACVLAAAGMALALAHKRFAFASAAAATLVVAATAGELVWKAQRVGFSGDRTLFPIDSDFVKFSESREDIDRVGVVYHPRVLRQGSAVGMLTGDRLFQGYHGLMLSRYARLLDGVGGLALAPRDADGDLLNTLDPSAGWMSPQMLPVMDLLNVRYVVTVEMRGAFSGLEPGQVRRFRQLQSGRFSVYENPAAMPPVYPIHEIIVCSNDDEAIAYLRDGRIDTRKTITVTGAFDVTGLRAPAAAEPVIIREYLPERITAEVELSTPAVVVFSEMYYPGWKAYVDGVEHEVLCVDTALRGVRAEAGRHTIVLRYMPASLRAGALVSVASVLAALVTSIGVLLHSRRRARREGGVTSA